MTRVLVPFSDFGLVDVNSLNLINEHIHDCVDGQMEKVNIIERVNNVVVLIKYCCFLLKI